MHAIPIVPLSGQKLKHQHQLFDYRNTIKHMLTLTKSHTFWRTNLWPQFIIISATPKGKEKGCCFWFGMFVCVYTLPGAHNRCEYILGSLGLSSNLVRMFKICFFPPLLFIKGNISNVCSRKIIGRIYTKLGFID